MDTVKRWVVARGWGEGRDEWVEHRGLFSLDTKSVGTLILDFLAFKTVRNKCLLFVNHSVYDILFSSHSRLRLGLTHLSKLIEVTTPRMNSNVKYGPWMIVTDQCWFIYFYKCTTLVGNVDCGGGCGYRGRRVERNSL